MKILIESLMSSAHLFGGRPRGRADPLGSHSDTIFAHLSYFMRDTCPAHFSFLRCTSCTAGQVIFAPKSGTIEIDTSGIIGTDAASGCLTLTATCTAEANYHSFMEFNYNQGGPAENANMGR
uniref:Uncharacterized protein n=1 Tax=Caenorhabditis japonica TaxID=281687 RepID=A0A8R1ID03_CAEJA